MNGRYKDTFSSYHPAVNLVFFAGAVISAMFLIHPAFLVCSLGMSWTYLFTIRGAAALRRLPGAVMTFVILAAVNPVFNTAGDTVLFTYAGGRAYTLEALYYGSALAAMFLTVITWFSCYNSVMTSDRFMQISGRYVPSVTLVVNLVMRLIPYYVRKTSGIYSARRAAGLAGKGSSAGEKIKDGMEILSAMMTHALEGSIILSDSMRSRGCGTARRSSFGIYRFGVRDAVLLAVMLISAACLAVCCAAGGAEAEYIPAAAAADPLSPVTAAGLASYCVFTIIPSVVNITEAIKWRILRSGI